MELQFYSGIPESLLTAQGEYPAVSGHHCILMVRKLRTSQFLVPDTELLKPF